MLGSGPVFFWQIAVALAVCKGEPVIKRRPVACSPGGGGRRQNNAVAALTIRHRSHEEHAGERALSMPREIKIMEASHGFKLRYPLRFLTGTWLKPP